MSMLFYCLFSNEEIREINSYPEIEATCLKYALMLVKIEVLRFIYTPNTPKIYKMRYKSYPER